MLFNKIINQKKKGAAALITLIILSTVLLLTGITLVLNSIDLNRSLKGFISSQFLFIQSRSCLEDAMSKLQFNSGFNGTVTFNSNGITCQAVVSNNAGNSNYRDINLSANNGEFYYSELKIVNISTNPITAVQ